MANSKLGPEGLPIGDPEGDLDYIPRHVASVAVAAELPPPTPEELFRERFDWIPHWQAEVTTALAPDLGRRINKAGSHHIAGAESIVDNVNGYISESGYDVRTLWEACDVKNEVSTLRPAEARNNQSVIRVLASHQLFTGSLETGRWPIHKRTALDKKLKPLMLKLYGADDQVISELWNKTFFSAVGRNRFWNAAREGFQDNPWVRQIDIERHHRRVS